MAQLVDGMHVALGGGHLGPAHDGHDGADVDALEEQERGRGVPGVVQAHLAHVGVAQDPLPLVVVGVGVDDRAPVGGEDQVVRVVPDVGALELEPQLGRAVGPQLGHERCRQGHRAP